MSELKATAASNVPHDPTQDTVWVENVSLIDRIPRAVSMALVFAAFIKRRRKPRPSGRGWIAREA